MKQWIRRIRRAALWAAALSLTATMAGCHTEPVTSAPETSGTAGSTSASGTAAGEITGTASGTQTSESQPDGSSVTPSTAPTEPQIRDMQGRTFVFCAPSWDVIDTEEPYIRAIEETYNCHLENLQLADYGTLYSSILATDPLADIIVLNDSNFFSFVQKKLLCNWNAVSTAEPSNGELYIVQRNADFTVDGKLYGLPVDASASTYSVNMDAWEALGLTEDDLPKTLLDLMEFTANWAFDYGDDYSEYFLFDWGQSVQLLLHDSERVSHLHPEEGRKDHFQHAGV